MEGAGFSRSPSPGREPAPPHQATQARERPVGDSAALAHDLRRARP